VPERPIRDLARISQTGWGFEGNRGSYTLKLLQ
jgi:hypothetical protein